MRHLKRQSALFLIAFIVLIGGLIVYTALLWQQAEINHQLSAAVQRDDPAAVRRALDRGADPSAFVQREARSSLQQLLLSLIRRRPARERSMTLLAASMNTPIRRATGLLIERGANPNLVDQSGTPMLMDAVYLGRADLVEALLLHGANPNLVNVDGDTALMWAANHGDADLVDTLLKHGANVNQQNRSGQTPLIWCLFGQFHLDELDNNDRSRMKTLIRIGRQRAIIEALAAHGANINVADINGNPTLLMPSISLSGQNFAPLLISHGADVNVRYGSGIVGTVMHCFSDGPTSAYGGEQRHHRTLLMEAAAQNDRQLIRLLLSPHADVTLRDDQGKTALDLAATPQVKALLTQTAGRR
jgi:ankyrin repeat protein